MRFLWIVDPWINLQPEKDTTARLMEAAIKAGHSSAVLEPDGISYSNQGVKLKVRHLLDFKSSPQTYKFSEFETLTAADFDQVHYRLDPPIDEKWITPLQLLCLNSELAAKILNPPEILFQYSEKWIQSLIPDAMAPSIISSNVEILEEFLKIYPDAVLKPLHSFQGQGVERLRLKNPPAEGFTEYFKTKTGNQTLAVIIQEYSPEIEKGEIRTWWVDGNLLASFRRHPLKGDFRVNMDKGSEIEALRSLPKELEPLIEKVRTLCHKLGIRLAAVDFIGNKIADFNFTSPGALREAEELTGLPLADQMIAALARPPVPGR